MATRFTVVATDIATDQLTAIWLNAPAERAAISRASHELERQVHFDADQKGWPAPTADHPGRRVLQYDPLRIFFKVSEPDRLVTIIGFDKISSVP